ncbi:uncharacterized protein LOC127139632 isoform X1 [Lates calcarifer]|uniref:Uncharacterized protein LOC127139632 isoform X1 n=1 Tax=Lates calcarifer TaxID=8187 RepID=A0AAJ8AZM8_LATCA|nr:uncharacterized protein LOC127139632 isoform X1 [Lates calcarifer]
MEGSELERPDSPEPESKQDPGPGPGRVSMNRDHSTEGPTELKDGQTDVIHQRPDSPGPSLVSLKSDQSMGEPLTFKDGLHSVDKRIHQQSTDSPGPSLVSMKSDQSMGEPLTFKDGPHSVDKRIHQQRPDSVGPSLVSMKSDQSMGEPLTFKEERLSVDKRTDKKTSEVPTDYSAQHQSHLDSIFMLLEENIVRFVKNELKNFQKLLSPDYPECLRRQAEDEEVLDGEDEEQRRSSREEFLKITLNFLRRMKQEELADCLQSRHVAPVCRL